MLGALAKYSQNWADLVFAWSDKNTLCLAFCIFCDISNLEKGAQIWPNVISGWEMATSGCLVTQSLSLPQIIICEQSLSAFSAFCK